MSIVVALAGVLIAPAVPAHAMECLGVRGVACVSWPPKQCVTDPCY